MFVDSKCIGLSGLFQLSSIDCHIDAAAVWVGSDRWKTNAHIRIQTLNSHTCLKFVCTLIQINYLIAYVDAVKLNWYQTG